MKKLLGIITLAIIMTSCGKIDSIVEIKGEDGMDAEACYTDRLDNGVNIICPDSSSFIADGRDGDNGVDGEDGKDLDILAYEVVCPEIRPNQYMETLLKLNGEYLAYFTDGNSMRSRLSVLAENVTYQTTDGRNVRFTIEDESIVCLP